MNKTIKNILKIFLVGLATTVVRIIGQLSIPAGEQTVLAPSIFAQNGTMPLVFTVYGVFAYSLIAALFLLIRTRIGGNRILQGLKYGLSCCVVWIVYLLEPLPHVAPLDRITYPIADSLALIVMGLLLGRLFGNPAQQADKKNLPFPILPVLTVTACWRSFSALFMREAHLSASTNLLPWKASTAFSVWRLFLVWMKTQENASAMANGPSA